MGRCTSKITAAQRAPASPGGKQRSVELSRVAWQGDAPARPPTTNRTPPCVQTRALAGQRRECGEAGRHCRERTVVDGQPQHRSNQGVLHLCLQRGRVEPVGARLLAAGWGRSRTAGAQQGGSVEQRGVAGRQQQEGAERERGARCQVGRPRARPGAAPASPLHAAHTRRCSVQPSVLVRVQPSPLNAAHSK